MNLLEIIPECLQYDRAFDLYCVSEHNVKNQEQNERNGSHTCMVTT